MLPRTGTAVKGGTNEALPLRGTRALLEATINVYATHLTTWGRFNSNIRGEQLRCLGREVRASRYPYILAGDFNTGPDSPEMKSFERENIAQLASKSIGPTFPHWNEQIDYIFADHGWRVRGSRTWPIKTSDHLPVTAELMWGDLTPTPLLKERGF